MIPNNNLSVLPFYGSIDEQNARHWWVYGRQYPLYTPKGRIPPFQIMRAHGLSPVQPSNQIIGAYIKKGDYDYSSSLELENAPDMDLQVAEFDFPTAQAQRLYVNGMPSVPAAYADNAVMGAIFTARGQRSQSLNPISAGTWSGYIEIAVGQRRVYLNAAESYAMETGESPSITQVDLFAADGTQVAVSGLTEAVRRAIQTYQRTTADGTPYDVLVYSGNAEVIPSVPIGQYYMRITDGVNTWYSDVFTVVDVIDPYLKIEWWDEEDFVMDAGVIVYQAGFRNRLYLQSDLAKPEYVFTEEGQERDGYFFPTKQISEKRYRFSFWAPEYLLDVMRLIRLSDHVQITYKGGEYNADSFLITPEWEGNGDLASVDAEFDTATVAKKTGVGIIRN